MDFGGANECPNLVAAVELGNGFRGGEVQLEGLD